jgi:hypothetical protein
MVNKREIRRIMNTKEDSIESSENSSLHGMADGQISMSKNPNKPLAIYRKKFGRLWKSYMSSDGNEIVDKNLSVGGNLNVRGNIYGKQLVMFCHNFADDIGTTEHYLPWSDAQEGTGITSGAYVGFLTPYSMTLKKIQFRIDTISQQGDITFKIKRVDSGDNTADEIASAEFDATIEADTMYELNRSDFNNNPKVVADSMAVITIHSDEDIDEGGLGHSFYITSVWEVEIFI